jgi:hypothetical protein
MKVRMAAIATGAASAGGLISGTPTATGTFPLAVSANDGPLTSPLVTFDLVISATPPPPPVASRETVKYVYGLSQAHCRWQIGNVAGGRTVFTNRVILAGYTGHFRWLWEAITRIVAGGSNVINTSRGFKLRAYYIANGSQPLRHEVGALAARAAAPAASSRVACS